jgi:hypothetical protein
VSPDAHAARVPTRFKRNARRQPHGPQRSSRRRTTTRRRRLAPPVAGRHRRRHRTMWATSAGSTAGSTSALGDCLDIAGSAGSSGELVAGQLEWKLIVDVLPAGRGGWRAVGRRARCRCDKACRVGEMRVLCNWSWSGRTGLFGSDGATQLDSSPIGRSRRIRLLGASDSVGCSALRPASR